MAADSEFANYFKLSKVDASNIKSFPPYLCGTLPGRIYGGLLVSQAANAFTTLHPELVPHTVNYKFIAAGNSTIPIKFKLNHFDDGTVSSIMAYQKDKLVGIGHVRHSTDTELLDSSRFLSPDVVYINAFPSVEELALRGQVHPTMTVDSLKPSDGFVVLMFLSDCTMFLAASEIYQRAGIKINSLASLHHTVWVHERNVDPLSWYLSITDCEVISHGRALQRSRIFNESRRCVLTVVQEGYLERAKEGKL